MGEIAQTNLQLYNQLIELRWPADDLRQVRTAYDLAAELFSGRYRCSGKPFVAHLVGTASVVAETDGRPKMVCAALLHAAYDTGDFGRGRRARDRRSIVSGAVGTRTEHLVDLYASTPASADVLASAATDGAGSRLPEDRRDVLLLRIANEVDEHADFGTRYCDKRGHELYGEAAIEHLIALAEALDRPRLAERCRQILVVERAEAAVPAVLRTDGLGSELVVPGSYSPRASIALRTTVGRALRSVPGGRRVITTVRRWR